MIPVPQDPKELHERAHRNLAIIRELRRTGGDVLLDCRSGETIALGEQKMQSDGTWSPPRKEDGTFNYDAPRDVWNLESHTHWLKVIGFHDGGKCPEGLELVPPDALRDTMNRYAHSGGIQLGVIEFYSDQFGHLEHSTIEWMFPFYYVPGFPGQRVLMVTDAV